MRLPLSRLFVVLLALFVIGLQGCSKKKKADDLGSVDGGGFETGDGSGDTLGAGGYNPNLKTVFFAYDNYSLTSAARATLRENSSWLKDNPTYIIQIEGHCDERGSIEYNLALGEKRANSVKKYMERLGVESSRLSIISYGEERPSDTETNEAAWAKNRRAEFVVLSQ